MIKSFRKENISARPIILWGGTMYGEMAYQVISNIWHGEIAAIIDHKYSRVSWFDKELMHPDKVKEYWNADIIICAAGGFQSVYNEALRLGKNVHIYDLKEILKEYQSYCTAGSTLLHSSYLYGTNDLDESIQRYNYCAGEDNGYDNKIYLPYCMVCVTSRCTLRCKDCAAMITKYKTQRDYPLEGIKNYIGKLLDAVDRIVEFEIMGGEPFLYSEFDALLAWCCEQDKINAVRIVTNGTIMPKESTWEIMKHNKVKLVVDDYGKLSGKFESVIDLAKKNGIRYEEQRLSTWYKLEPISKKQFSETRLKEIYNNCNFKPCIGIIDGRFYHCNVAGHMHTLGLIDDENSDCIDLRREWNTAELRKEIKTLLDIEYLKACDFCSYYKNVEIPVAEQEVR